MTLPTAAQLYEARDKMVEAVNKAISEVIGLYDQPYLKHETADSCDAAQDALDGLAGLVSDAADRKIEAGDFSGIARGLRLLADNPRLSDWRADRADYLRGLKV